MRNIDDVTSQVKSLLVTAVKGGGDDEAKLDALHSVRVILRRHDLDLTEVLNLPDKATPDKPKAKNGNGHNRDRLGDRVDEALEIVEAALENGKYKDGSFVPNMHERILEFGSMAYCSPDTWRALQDVKRNLERKGVTRGEPNAPQEQDNPPRRECLW
jgi:hypothetical protein